MGWMLAGLLAFASCKKDEARAIAKVGSSASLSASSTTLVMDSTKSTSDAVTFSWTAASYNYSAVVTYSLEFDVPTDSFASPTSVSIGSNVLSKTYTVADFNKLAYQTLHLAANVASAVQVRVKSSVNQTTGSASSLATTYSDTLNLTVTPYQIIIVYPLLYVPGDYQGWSPASAPSLASVLSNNSYSGYVYFPSAAPLFKFTSQADWNGTNYGKGASAGTLSTTGDNLTLTAAGYYLLTANTSSLTWSSLATTWAIIGDAPTASNSWANDVPLSYDASSGTWSVTTACGAGNFKFRANGGWDLNYGDNSPADGVPDAGGDNIAIAAAGTYTITLDLSHAGNYTYSVKKN